MRLDPVLVAGLVILPALAAGVAMPPREALSDALGAPACHLARAATEPVCVVVLQVVDAPERVTAVEAPVSVGAVFPRDRVQQYPDGSLTPMLLVDGRDVPVPFTVRPTGWWEPQGDLARDVKWVLLHFRARSDGVYRLLVGSGVRVPDADGPRVPAKVLAVPTPAGEIRVDTGPMEVALSAATPHLFARVSLDAAGPHASAGLEGFAPAGELRLVAHNGTHDVPTMLRDWRLEVEASTNLHAVVRGTGVFQGDDGRDYAKLDVRLRFFLGETFVRVEHTFTWLVRPLEFGVRELSVRMQSPLQFQKARLGLDDYTNASVEVNLGSRLEAVQHSATAWTGTHGLAGDRLGGWLEGVTAAGTGVGLALRNVWQEHPKAFAGDRQSLAVQLWPASREVMSFREDAIMPPDYFCSFFWSAHAFATNNTNTSKGAPSKCHGHEIPTTGGLRSHPIYGPDYFEHTGEGAARTHDLVVSFLGPAARPTAELNSLLQHPLVVRQDPASALAVPFLGIRLAPADPEGYPGLEQAIEDTARLALARWEYTRGEFDGNHDYGFWRHGFLRYAYPGPGGWLARWMDGTQYDLQLIPWALWVRGGDHDFYEEAIDTARHAMDVATNHFSTRKALLYGQTPRIGGPQGEVVEHWPPGFSKAASSMPFPGTAAEMFLYQTKVHYLSLLHHLTGDERAREVMEEVVASAKLRAAIDYPEPLGRWGARLAYNMNLFWSEAYMETWDPELLPWARQWLDVLKKEFHAGLGQWKMPVVYVWHALLEALQLYGDLGLDPGVVAELRDMLLQNLDVLGLRGSGDGVLRDYQGAVAAGWAAEATGDARYALVAFDLARTIADAQPAFVHEPDRAPRWTQSVVGNSVWRGVLAPMLVGVSEAARRGLGTEDAPWVRDVHLSVAVDAGGVGRLTAFVRPTSRGDVPVDVRVADSYTPNCAVPPTTVRAFQDGEPVVDAAGKGVGATITMEVADRSANPFPLRNPTQGARLVLPDAQPGHVYRLEVEVAAAQPGVHCPGFPGASLPSTTRVRLDAGDVPLVVLVRFPELNLTEARKVATAQGDVCDARSCVEAFRGGRSTPYAGSRLVLRTTNDTIAVWNPSQQPYTIRDAATGEELFRYVTTTTTKLLTHQTGADRLIVLTVRDAYYSHFGVHGVAPLVAATPGTWFDPGAAPGGQV